MEKFRPHFFGDGVEKLESSVSIAPSVEWPVPAESSSGARKWGFLSEELRLQAPASRQKGRSRSRL